MKIVNCVHLASNRFVYSKTRPPGALSDCPSHPGVAATKLVQSGRVWVPQGPAFHDEGAHFVLRLNASAAGFPATLPAEKCYLPLIGKVANDRQMQVECPAGRGARPLEHAQSSKQAATTVN
jgi:hypothetical protein